MSCIPTTLLNACELTSFYLPIKEVFPAQLRYASPNVKQKVCRKILNGEALWNDSTGKWVYQHDDGKSIFPLSQAIPVVKASFGHVLIDGHHDVLASLFLGALTISVQITADFSHLSIEDFWQAAEQQGFAYLYDLNGKRKIPPRDFQLLEDDPNRYFAALTARKYTSKNGENVSQQIKTPLWIKRGKDIPFIEFKIANLLRCNGIHYHYAMGDEPPEEFIESARQILISQPIHGLQLIASKM